MRTSHSLTLILSLSLSFALTSLGGCGDDSSTGGDSGMEADSGVLDSGGGDAGGDDSAVPSDSSVPTDAMPPACSPTTCINGVCDAGDMCDCERGWTGPACDMLAEPTEDGVLLWFDADDEGGFMTSDDEGTTRVDQWLARTAVSGPVIVTPLVADQRPALVVDTAFANGRPTVAFEASGTALKNEGSFWTGINGVTEHTTFVVFSSAAVEQQAFTVNQRGTSEGYSVGSGSLFASVAGTQRTTVAASPSDSATINRLHLVTFRVADEGTTLRLDGADASAGGPADDLAIDMAEVILGAQASDGTQPLAGNVAEVIVFNGALRTGVMTAVEDYLDAKWL